MHPARAVPLALARGASVHRVALARGPDGALWIALRALPSRFARRPRTTILAGALAPDGSRWTIAPIEVASLPGRADLPLAIAAHARGATVLIARPHAVLLREVPLDGQAPAALEWGAPRRASGPPLLDAQGPFFSIAWRGAARISLHTADANAPLEPAPHWTHARRTGALAGDGLSAIVALSASSTGIVHALRTGATRLTVIDRGAIAARRDHTARCPDRCALVEVRAVPSGALALYAMPIPGERTLSRYWASRVTLEGNGHTAVSIPIARGLAAPGGLGRDALLQVGIPLILRGISRPVALDLDPSIRTLPDALAVRPEQDGTFLAVGAHRPGALSIARARCSDSP